MLIKSHWPTKKKISTSVKCFNSLYSNVKVSLIHFSSKYAILPEKIFWSSENRTIKHFFWSRYFETKCFNDLRSVFQVTIRLNQPFWSFLGHLKWYFFLYLEHKRCWICNNHARRKINVYLKACSKVLALLCSSNLSFSLIKEIVRVFAKGIILKIVFFY